MSRTHEREADRRAGDAMLGSAPQAGRVMPLATHAIPDSVPPIAREAISAPGEPLDEATRAMMEPRFGHDFGRVRVHAGPRAADSARRLGAQAYTVGTDIVLGGNAPAPRTHEGRHLLAHELAHVVQQASGAGVQVQRRPTGMTDYRFDTGHITAEDLEDPIVRMKLSRMTRPQLRAYRASVADPAVRDYITGLLAAAAPTQSFETGWLTNTRADIEAEAGRKYWEQKTWKAYDTTYSYRQGQDPEERDAVYAAFWSVHPTPTVAAANSIFAKVPPTAHRKKELLYRFDLAPPADPVKDPRPVLKIEFIAEREGGVVQEAVAPPARAKVPSVTFATDNLPGGADAYFKTHPEEQQQIFYWIQRQPTEFEGHVLTKTVRPTLPPIEALFHIRGIKDERGDVRWAVLKKLADRRPVQASVPQNYRTRDTADLMLEEAQNKPHPEKNDVLGYVDLTGVPMDELYSVKYMVASYWTAIKTRNAEVDVLVPITGKKSEVFYTLRFRPDNEVDVERVGEKGSTEKLDPGRLDVARVRGYSENADDPAKLKTWLGKRYKGVKPAGTTVEELRQSANTEMAARASTGAWFKDNYSMTVLDGAATLQRLRTAHKQTAVQTPDTDKKDFAADELKTTELSLQTLTDAIIAKLAALRLGRKTISRDAAGADKGLAGEAFSNGGNRSVVLYDSAFRGKSARVFVGGPGRVNLAETETITHEFGHIVEYTTSGLRDAFNKFVKAENIQPITAYSASKPESEFFAEAFALAQTDPEWLRNNHPKIYEFFEKLNKTGTVPPKK